MKNKFCKKACEDFKFRRLLYIINLLSNANKFINKMAWNMANILNMSRKYNIGESIYGAKYYH